MLSFRGADKVRKPGIHNHESPDMSEIVDIVAMGSGLTPSACPGTTLV